MNKSNRSKKIQISLSLLEAALIKKIRNHSYGKFTIFKIEGEPRKLEMWGSVIFLDEKDADFLIE